MSFSIGTLGTNFGVSVASGIASLLNSAPLMLRSSCTVHVNGRTYTGSSVVCKNGEVFVDGKRVNDDEPEVRDGKLVLYRNADIRIEGNVDGAVQTTAGDVTVVGQVRGGIRTVSGDVDVEGDVLDGSVSTVSGDVEISGSCNGRPSSVSGKIKVQGTKRALPDAADTERPAKRPRTQQ